MNELDNIVEELSNNPMSETKTVMWHHDFKKYVFDVWVHLQPPIAEVKPYIKFVWEGFDSWGSSNNKPLLLSQSGDFETLWQPYVKLCSSPTTIFERNDHLQGSSIDIDYFRI